MNYEYVIFIIDGGIGKNIMSTIPIRGLKKKYPDKKLIIVSGWPDVFKYNPNVHLAYNFNNLPHFYDNYVLCGKSLILKTEPYYHRDYVSKKRHLCDVWCEQLDVEFDKNLPQLFFSKDELQESFSFVSSKHKPCMLMQIHGGPNMVKQPFSRMISLDLAKAVADRMSNTHHILLAAYKEQPSWQGVEKISYPLRASMSLVPFMDKLFLIDSMFQHAAAACNKQSVVLWPGTSPEILGYNVHVNLRKQVCPDPECHRPNPFLFDFSHSNQELWSCPYGKPCTNWDADEIVKALLSTKTKTPIIFNNDTSIVKNTNFKLVDDKKCKMVLDIEKEIKMENS